MYATLAQLKDYLSITSTADDALLTDLLERATAVIEQMTRKAFAGTLTSTAREFGREAMLWDGVMKRDYLLLPSGCYIAALTGAKDGDGAAIPLTEIDKHPPDAPYTVLARRDKRWCGRTQTAEITAIWRYSIAPPDDIVHATIRLAAWLYRQRGTANDPDRPTVADGGLVLLPSALPDDVRLILERYRDVV
jgi:hypothetical protein